MRVNDDWHLLKVDEWTVDEWILMDGEVFDVSEAGCVKNNVSIIIWF